MKRLSPSPLHTHFTSPFFEVPLECALGHWVSLALFHLLTKVSYQLLSSSLVIQSLLSPGAGEDSGAGVGGGASLEPATGFLGGEAASLVGVSGVGDEVADTTKSNASGKREEVTFIVGR